MKHSNITAPVRLLLFLILIAAIAGILTSCGVHKNIDVLKSTYDSAYDHLKDSFSRVIREKEEAHKKELETKNNSRIVFNTPCPPSPTWDSLRLKLDSAGKANLDDFTRDYNRKVQENRTLKNKVRILADGSIEAEGQIAEVNLNLERKEAENNTLRETNDSLKQSNSRLVGSVTSQVIQKQKSVKRGPGIGLLILFFFTGFIVGCIFWHKRRKIWNRLNLFKQTTMKFLMFLLGLSALSSCAHFHDEPSKSVWAEGLWLVFWIPFLGGCLFLLLALLSQRSGTWKIISGATTKEPGGKMKLTRFGKFIIGAALIIASIVIAVMVNSDR